MSLQGQEPEGNVTSTGSELKVAQAAFSDGMYQLAEKQFEKLLKAPASEKEAAEVTLLLARSLQAQEKFTESIGLLQDNWSFGKVAEELPAFTFWLGKAFFDSERPADALAVLHKLASEEGDDPYINRCMRLQARCLIKLDQHIDALVIFNQTEKRLNEINDPDAAPNYLDWASTLIALDRKAEAKDILQRMSNLGLTNDSSVQRGLLWLAKLRLADMQYEEAQLILKDLTLSEVVEGPIRGEAWFTWAELYDATGSVGEAMKALEKAEAFFDDKKTLARLRIHRAKLLIKSGEMEKGAALLSAEIPAVSGEVTAAQAQLFLAQALLDEGSFTAAEKAFQAYLEAYEDPQDTATMGKAWSLMGLERYPEAVAAFEKVVNAGSRPESVREALFKVADAHYANRQFEEAHKNYKQYARTYVGSELLAQALFQGAMCLLRQEKEIEAEQEFRKVIAVFPESEFAERSYLQFAYILQDKGLWDASEKAYSDYLKTYSSALFSEEALLNRGFTRYYLLKFRAAHDDFKQIVDQFGDGEQAERAYFMRGWCLHMLGDETGALAVCNQFLEAYPETSWADDVLFWMAEFYWNKKLYAKAEDRFKFIVDNYPSAPLVPNAFFWAGRSAFEQKSFEPAIQYFSSVVTDSPEHELVPEALFYQGDALTELGRFSAAILVFEQIIKNFPDSWLVYHAWGRKGDCERTEGDTNPERFQEAIKSWQTIIDAQEATPELKLKTHFRMAGTYTVLKKNDAALEHYLKAFYAYLADRDKLGASAVNYFTRSGFLAAELFVDQGEYGKARNIYRRIIQSGVPAAAEAETRLSKSYYLKELTQ